MINHHVSDLTSRINNLRLSPFSNGQIVLTQDNLLILKKLEDEGFLKISDVKSKTIFIEINKINQIKVISTPGRRIYRKWKQLNSSLTHIYLVRTSKGILTHLEAISFKLGGEILLKIF